MIIITSWRSWRWLIFSVIIVLFCVIPVSAAYQIQNAEDNKIQFSNGSYWIKWDRIGNHTVGDQFFVNATTNFPVGTELHFMVVPIDFSHNYSEINQFPRIQKADNQGFNTTSVLVNTTSLQSGYYSYVFTISVTFHADDLESDFRNGGVLAGNVPLYTPSGDVTVIYDTPPGKTRTLQKKSPVSVILVITGIFFALLVFRKPERK